MARHRVRRMRKGGGRPTTRTAETSTRDSTDRTVDEDTTVHRPRANPRFWESRGDYQIPGGGVGKRVKDERQRLRDSGVSGSDLRSQIRDYREGAKTSADADARAAMGELGLTPEQQATIAKPRAYMRKMLEGGRWGKMGQENMFRGTASSPSEQALESHLLGSLEGENGAPGHSAFDQRIAEMNAKGEGLTPAEWDTYQRQGVAAVQGGADQMMRSNSQRMAAAGVDPRSGYAADRGMQIQQQRTSGMADVGDQLRRLDLQRKKDWEGYGMNRLGGVEGRLAGLAGLDEQQYQYNRDIVEGRKQSAMERQAIKDAAEEAMPTTGDKVIAGIGGFVGGLSGGGGGGV